MTRIDRRRTLQSIAIAGLACSVPTFALANEQLSAPGVADWIDRLHRNAQQLRNQDISSLQWQEAMNVIYGEVSVPELQKSLSFKLLQQEILDLIGPERGELFRQVTLPGSRDVDPTEKEPHRVLITKVAHIKKGRSVPPHGHSNMVSAFLCISGEFAVRQYDKLEENETEMVLRQTVDEPSAGVGTWSSISDYQNNVHWLTAKTDDCYLFTSKLIGVETGRPMRGRINVDVRQAKSLGTATLRAPKISNAEAAERY